MSNPLPLRPSIDYTPRPRSVIDLREASTVLDALGSETARTILDRLGDEPATASEIADDVGTSVQNAQYHLENLSRADLVSEAGTWYSSKGKEMTVYALASERVAIRFRDGSPSPENREPGGLEVPQ